MRLTYFRIENFRNIKFAECTDAPQFMVICGGNGCGKSTLLQAIMTAKEHAGSYGGFTFDPRAVSADSSTASITLTLEYTEQERDFAKEKMGSECPKSDTFTVVIDKNGVATSNNRSMAAYHILSNFSRGKNPLGYFDFIESQRLTSKIQLTTLDTNMNSDIQLKQSLAQGSYKFQNTKQYLALLVLRDVQKLQADFLAIKENIDETIQKSQVSINVDSLSDSLKDIRLFFNNFFYPMKFERVLIHTNPYQFIVSTPKGDIDIDDLSSGEKEIFNTYVRFHQLKPQGSIILFDEADAHLHPDLDRRYLESLRDITSGNQLILTTHSPEMMIVAGTNALYTVLKDPSKAAGNQLVRVTDNEQLHSALVELMGSRGLISFNQRVIFIEGEDASADREIYEALYPQSKYHVSFVPAGDSATVRKTAERVNELLSVATGFQQYFSIVDGDIDRLEPDPTSGKRLFRLPVYHVENVLLDEEKILAATRTIMRLKSPFSTVEEVQAELKRLALTDIHIKQYTHTLLDAKIAQIAKQAHDAMFKKEQPDFSKFVRPDFLAVESEARQKIEDAIADGTWRSKCKGRDLLKAYCRVIDKDYETFRNTLIEKFTEPPQVIDNIMQQILQS